jgi:signal transduction histidine kinase
VRGPVTDAQRLDLLRIQRSKNHLDALVGDVLSFAKTGAGKLEFDICRVEVQRMLSGVLEMVTPQLAEKELCLEAPDVSPDLAVTADEDKVRQILLNLLFNALKFTPRHGTISVGVAADDATVRIAVTDTGIGVPAEHLERIFEPFVQAKRALSSTDQGVGLGLAISRQLARAMHGDLTAHSVVDEGSSFTLALPRAEEREGA